MAKQVQAALDVYLLDLSGTLRETERFAEDIERQLASAHHPPSRPPPPLEAEGVAGILSVSAALVAEAHRLVENVKAGRILLRQLQAECTKLRHG